MVVYCVPCRAGAEGQEPAAEVAGGGGQHARGGESRRRAHGAAPADGAAGVQEEVLPGEEAASARAGGQDHARPTARPH